MNNRDKIRNPETCPGLREFLRPTLSYVKCHVCGGNVELWSDEDIGMCTECNEEWRRPGRNNACLDYCEYADKCRSIIGSRKV